MGDEATRSIEVTTHALEQLAKRRPHLAVLLPHERRKMILRLVAAAIAEGRISEKKPAGFELYGRGSRRGLRLPPGQRCAWTPDEEIAFVLVRESRADVVITTLTRACAP